MDGQLPRLNIIRRETNQLKNQVALISARVCRLRSDHGSNLQEVARIEQQVLVKGRVRNRRQRQDNAKLNREIRRNNDLYDLQERIRIRRDQSLRTKLSAYEQLEALKSVNAGLIQQDRIMLQRLRAEHQEQILKQNRERAESVKLQMSRIEDHRAGLQMMRKQASAKNYRDKCEQQIRRRDSAKKTLQTLENQEVVELEKLKESEIIRDNALELLRSTIRFRRHGLPENAVTPRKFSQL